MSSGMQAGQGGLGFPSRVGGCEAKTDFVFKSQSQIGVQGFRGPAWSKGGTVAAGGRGSVCEQSGQQRGRRAGVPRVAQGEGYLTMGGLFPDSFKQKAIACCGGRRSSRQQARVGVLTSQGPPNIHPRGWEWEPYILSAWGSFPDCALAGFENPKFLPDAAGPQTAQPPMQGTQSPHTPTPCPNAQAPVAEGEAGRRGTNNPPLPTQAPGVGW